MTRFILLFAFVVCTGIVRAQEKIELLPADTFAVWRAKTEAKKHSGQGDRKEESRYYDQIGLIYWEHNYFDDAVVYYERSLALNEQLGNRSGVSMINHNLGMIHADLARYDTALKYFQKALDYRRMDGKKTDIITVLINMSVVHNNLKRFDESVKLLDEALTLAREMNNVEQMKSCYGMLSETYEKAKNREKANYYFELYKTFHEKLQEDKVTTIKKTVTETQLKLQLSEAERINKELQLRLAAKEIAQQGQSIENLDSTNRTLYQNLTKVEMQRKLLEQDAKIQETALAAETAIREKQQLQIAYLWAGILVVGAVMVILGWLFRQKNRLNKTIEERNRELEKLTLATSQTENAIMITNRDGDVEWINRGYTKLYNQTLDDIHSGDKNILNSKFSEQEFAAIQATIEQRQSTTFEKGITHNDHERWIQTTVTPIFDAKTAIIKRFVFIDSDISQLKASEQRIERQALSMTDSINYASLIQKAMLAKGKRIENMFDEAFIIYLPRNIVSGDFYWGTTIGDVSIVVAADCTGHGVPGAFMSMIGMNLLNQIVETEGITKPHQILERLHSGVRFSLNQDQNSNQDGMDAAVCAFDRRTKILHFASAHRPVVIFQNGKMDITKGNRQSIGGGFTKIPTIEFTHHQRRIDTETCVYLYSDGFTDQFSYTTGRKFNSSKMKEMLQDNHAQQFEEQGNTYLKTIQDWQGKTHQTDDILLIGFKCH